MNQTICYQLDLNQFKKIQIFFKAYRCETKNEYLLAAYQYEKVHLSIYQSLKMVIQGSDLKKIQTLFKKEFDLNLNLNENQKINSQNSAIDLNHLIGCDEVGVGDFFGGLVTACVYLEDSDYQKAKQYQLADSKQLSDSQILALYPTLIQEFKYATAAFSPSEYNAFYTQFPNNHLVKTYLHNKALSRLIHQYQLVDYEIVMDAYVSKNKYEQYLKTLKIDHPVMIQHFETKAESKYLAVAIASMIARGMFLTQMEKLNQALGMNLPLGINYDKIYPVSFALIDQYGLDKFAKLTKHHFKTYQMVLEAYQNQKK